MKIKNENLVNYSIILFGLYPVMPNNLKGFLMIIFFFSGLNYFLKKKKKKIYTKPFVLNSTLFFIYLLSLVYSNDMYYGFKNLGPAISILFFPLAFYIFLSNFKLKRKIIQNILNLFSISTFFLMIYFMIYFSLKILPLFPDVSFFDINYIRSYLRVLPMIGHHPIYISIYLGISIINLLNLIFKYIKKEIDYIFPTVLILIFLLFSLFYVSSKGSILSLFLIALIIYFLKEKNKIQSLFIGFVALCTVTGIIFLTPHINNRFKELIKSETYSTQHLDKNNSSQIRVAIWKTSIDKIKNAPIFGYGIGDVQRILNESYKNNYPYLLNEQYNSHNQYFGVWLSTGLIGLLFFLLLFYFNFKIAIQNQDYVFIAVLLFFSFNFLTENVIERQAGANLFFFFINLFGFYNYKNTFEVKKN